TISHHGEFFAFDEVVFEPKPVQKPWPPILVGGESKAALRRAARLGDGWLGMGHSFESAETQIAQLRGYLAKEGRSDEGVQIIVGGPFSSRDEGKRGEALAIPRMTASPWRRSREALENMQRSADASLD